MDDRKLIELAAKAVGKTVERWADGGAAEQYGDCAAWDGLGWWNPRDDDGDAFRLAVKLRMRIDLYDEEVEVSDGVTPYRIGREVRTNTFVMIEPCDPGSDACAATRCAILQAAAQIGGGA